MEAGSSTAPISGFQSPTVNTTFNMVDNRPELSPYAGPHTTLRFADGLPFSVPTGMVNKFFWLNVPSLADYFKHVPSSCGHVIVHYLFTGTYQCLKPEGESQEERDIAEFTTCARIYKIAGDYLLFALRNLVRDEMERLTSRLQVTQILDVMRDVHPTLADTDTWLRHFLKSLVERLIDNPSIPILYGSSQSFGHHASIASVLVGSTIEICRERLQAPPRNSPTVIAFQGHVYETQSRGAIHSEHKSILDMDLRIDKNAKEGKGEGSEQKQGNLGQAVSATGSNSSTILADEKSKLIEEREQPGQRNEGSNEAVVNSTRNITWPRISLAGVDAQDSDSASEVPTPVSSSSGESTFGAPNPFNRTG
ncbi:hypothetical protein F4774DRAFT_390626 [Daldinia eschscholtzii]|nr:hypothetical protein F4774DRAFT_390626 [Daldinia eschscholtzii]